MKVPRVTVAPVAHEVGEHAGTVLAGGVGDGNDGDREHHARDGDRRRIGRCTRGTSDKCFKRALSAAA